MSDDDHELAMLRRKKMARLMAREKQLKEEKERKEKTANERRTLLTRILAPDALSYLDSIHEREPHIGKRIEDIILHLVVYRGLRKIITQLEVRYIERQIKGEGPTIKVQRDGETSDFGSYVREALRKEDE